MLSLSGKYFETAYQKPSSLVSSLSGYKILNHKSFYSSDLELPELLKMLNNILLLTSFIVSFSVQYFEVTQCFAEMWAHSSIPLATGCIISSLAFELLNELVGYFFSFFIVSPSWITLSFRYWTSCDSVP